MSIEAYIRKEFDKGVEDIVAEYRRVCSRCDYLQKRLDEYNKDEEIQGLEERIQGLHRNSLMIMSDKERDDDEAFRQEHYETCNNGSTFCYELSGTGIGTVIIVSCPVCGAKKNITDINSW